MKFLAKVLFTLLLLAALGVAGLYMMLQSHWGTNWVSRYISENSDYQLHFSKIEYRLSDPFHLLLNDVTLGHKGQAPLLTAKQVDLGLGLTQFVIPLHFPAIHLTEGVVMLSDEHKLPPLSADHLQLSRMKIENSQYMLPVTAEKVDGAITPWKPVDGNVIGDKAHFQFSASHIKLADFSGQNLLLEGMLADHKLTVTNAGVDLAGGTLTGSAIRDAGGNWLINSLRLSGLHLQTTKSLNDIFASVLALPSVHVKRLDVTNAQLEGEGWAASDLDLSLDNLTLSNNDWQSNGGTLLLNASTIVKNGLQLSDPIINVSFSPQGITIRQLSTRWAQGLIRTYGRWSRADKKLTLDDAALVGLEYTLPENWRDIWMAALPDWLNSVQVLHFSANRNLIIDINPEFPFQMTSLEGNGSNLLLVKDHQWGIWGGKMSFNAFAATFNRVELYHPSISLGSNDEQIEISELSAFIKGGLLEANGTVTQSPQRLTQLNLTGRNVPLSFLKNWGWPATVLQDTGRLEMTLDASLAAGTELRKSMNATLSNSQGEKTVSMRMTQGMIVQSQTGSTKR